MDRNISMDYSKVNEAEKLIIRSRPGLTTALIWYKYYLTACLFLSELLKKRTHQKSDKSE